MTREVYACMWPVKVLYNHMRFLYYVYGPKEFRHYNCMTPYSAVLHARTSTYILVPKMSIHCQLLDNDCTVYLH